MKILHIASGDLWAGAEKQFYTLLLALAKQDKLEVMAIILNPGTLADKLQRAGITTQVLDESQQSGLELARAINRYLAQQSPDLVHTHRLKENTLGGLLAAWRGIPSVRTQHGSSEHTLDSRQLVKRLQNSLAWLVGRYLQKRIIAVSEPLARELRASFGNSRVCVIHNGLELGDTTGGPVEKPTGPLKVGFAGRLAPVKRVDLFLRIAQAVLEQGSTGNQPEFHILGDGPLRDDLLQQADDLGLADVVNFHGHVDNAEQHIAELDVLILCSDHEGLPMAALEAMKHHTLVLTYPMGGLPELLGEGRFGYLVASQSAQDFAAAIAEINENREMLTQRTALAYRQLVKNYSAGAMAHRHLELYRQVLDI